MERQRNETPQPQGSSSISLRLGMPQSVQFNQRLVVQSGAVEHQLNECQSVSVLQRSQSATNTGVDRTEVHWTHDRISGHGYCDGLQPASDNRPPVARSRQSTQQK